jgi:hypothetical protein
MTKIMNNAAGTVGASLVALLKNSEASKTGVFALVADHMAAMVQLAERHAASKNDENSVRAINLAFFADTPEGTALNARKEALKGETGNAEKKGEKAIIKARENTINMLLTGACDVAHVVDTLRAAQFKVILKRAKVDGKESGKIACYVTGPDDEMPCEFGVTKMKALAKHDIASCTSYAQLDSLLVGASNRSGKASNAKAGDVIPASKLKDAIGSLDTTIAGLSLAPNEGTSPASREAAIRLALRILANADPAEVARIQQAFDAESDDAATAAAAK